MRTGRQSWVWISCQRIELCDRERLNACLWTSSLVQWESNTDTAGGFNEPGDAGLQACAWCSLPSFRASSERPPDPSQAIPPVSSGLSFLQASILHVVWKVKMSVAQSCPTVCDPINCSLPGSSVHGILEARILEGKKKKKKKNTGVRSQPRDWTRVSHTAGRVFTVWATREAHYLSHRYSSL